MQVSVEKTKGLERRLTVQVPAERVDREVERRLKAMGKRAKIKGFRPGKVPMKVLEQHYGGDVRREVVSEVMQTTYAEAVQRENLNPAAAPEIEPVTMDTGTDLEFTATFEVYPEVKLKGVEKLKIQRPTVEISDADVDGMIENLRSQRATWDPVDRASQSGDSVRVDYVGRKDGEVFEGGSAESAVLELGADRLVDDFDAGLTGLTAGDTRTIPVTFPDDYPATELAGAAAEFEVTCHEVLGKGLPEIDEEFAKGFGVEDGSVETFRGEVRQSMEREAEQTIRSQLKNAVLDGVLEKNKPDLPNSLIDQEIDNMQAEAVSRLGGDKRSIEERPEREMFEDQARRRVSLGLIIGEIIREQKFELDRARVDARIGELVSEYADQDAATRNIRANRDLMQRLEMMIMEEQVVDWLLDHAKVKEKRMSFSDLMDGES